MASLNRVYLAGNLTKDPEVKYLPDGTAVADLRVAVNETYRSRTTGETVEQTCFVDVVAWRKQAETCGKFLSKGAPILVEGRLHLDEWEAQDGSKRSRLRVRAIRVQFLSAPRNSEFSDTSGSVTTEGGRAAQDESEGDRDGSFGQPAAGTVQDNNNLGDDDNLPF